ncbi:MAG: DUF4193 domain-containing protein [Bifidobacteriaceae bacterium]|jgi:hypothetical protein|nr:DUF4193 domain-containing protein [Bifidobacteriaceae bacterium]
MTTNYKNSKKVDSVQFSNSKKSKQTALSSKELDADLPLSSEYTTGSEEISGIDVDIDVVPPQNDEFTCSECFLVKHKSQLGKTEKGLSICKECM